MKRVKQLTVWAGMLAITGFTGSMFVADATGSSCWYSYQQKGVDSFYLQYQMQRASGRVKKIAWTFYAGFATPACMIKDTCYHHLVFGTSDTAVIGLARVNDRGLFYVPIGADNTVAEKPLLYFDKNVNDNWQVDIPDSYLFKKNILFEGTEQQGDDLVYIYAVNNQVPQSPEGNDIIKIYYSREKGFVKFLAKTHWISMEMTKKPPL